MSRVKSRLSLRDSRRPAGRLYGWAVGTLAASMFVFVSSWSVSMPIFDGPDELRHFNSIMRLADGGGWPLPYDAQLLPTVRQAFYEADLNRVRDDGTEILELPRPEERSLLFGPTELGYGARDYMVQHPPTYYVGMAVVYKAISSAHRVV